MSEPLVSICIPTYNGEKYLQEALDSVTRQTYDDIEVIISDDNSEDDTLKIISNFKGTARFPVYVYDHSPSNIGGNWNNCLQHANGEYIKFLFQDDVLFPECIEKMLEFQISQKGVDLVACQRQILMEEPILQWQQEWLLKYNNLQSKLSLPGKRFNIIDKKIFKKKEFVKDPFNKVGEPTAVLFKKSILEKTGLFREDLQIVLDLEFYYRVLKFFKIAIMNEELVSFRLHAEQASKKKTGSHHKDLEIFNNILFKEFFWNLHNDQKRSLIKYRLAAYFKK